MSRPSERLSPDERHELDEVLADRFLLIVSSDPGARRPSRRPINDPFWGLSIERHFDDEARLESFFRVIGDGDRTDNEAVEEHRLDLLQGADNTPRWWNTNPFSFDLKAIGAFFQRRYEQLLDTFKDEPPEIRQVLEPETVIGFFQPLSKGWMECAVMIEIAHREWCLQRASKLDKSNRMHLEHAAAASLGKIGRMVEQYRWRFSYGGDALRGRSNLAAAASGGQARSRETRAQNQAVLAQMQTRIDKGMTVSNAARLTANDGYGSSAEANRKLWTRHHPK